MNQQKERLTYTVRNIRAIRIVEGYSYGEFADELNRINPELRLSAWSIMEIEDGWGVVTWSVLEAIAYLMPLSIQDLVYRDLTRSYKILYDLYGSELFCGKGIEQLLEGGSRTDT